MKTLGFCLVYALLASAFCIGFAASQLPTESFFSILTGILVVLGIGFTAFFAGNLKENIKGLVASAGILLAIGGALIFSYKLPSVRANLIGSWSSETVLNTAMDQLNEVGSVACGEWLKRDRLTAIRAMADKPAYAKSQCLQNTDESLRRSVLTRWDERLMSRQGTPAFANAIQEFSEAFPDLAPHMLFDCAVSSESKSAQQRCVELSGDYKPGTGFAEQFEWWTQRRSLGLRFTEAFAKAGEGPMNNRLTRRVLLRQVCAREGDSAIDDSFNGWLRHVECAQSLRGNIAAEVCSGLSDNIDASQKITAESEVCAILVKNQAETERVRQKIEESAGQYDELNRAIAVDSSERPSLDEFLDSIQSDPNSVADFNPSDVGYLISEMQTSQMGLAQSQISKFSKEGMRKRKIEKVMKELQNKPAMKKYFNEDGSVNQEAVEEKAEEMDVENSDL